MSDHLQANALTVARMQAVAEAMQQNPELQGALPAFLDKILAMLKDPQVLAAILALVTGLFHGPAPAPVTPSGPHGGDQIS